jgi:hypothetical protein
VPSCYYLSKQKREANPYHPTVKSLEFGISLLRRADEKFLHATGMRSHDSTGPEPTLYPLGQTRQLVKAKPKSAVYPLLLDLV